MEFRSDLVMTVLHSRGRRLAKFIDSDGNVSNYDAARTFDMREASFSDLAELRDLLSELSERRDCCAVRGGIADPARTRGVRRLLHADGDDPATLVDVPRSWLALDIDGLAVPDYIDRRSVFECSMAVVNALPPAFRGAGFVAQASASFGRKPGAHLRLWLLLARAIDGSEASRWLALVRKSLASVDPACARPAQIIYTASPIFEGADDPIKTRIELFPGGAAPVPTPAELAPPPPPPPRPLPAIGTHVGANYARGALINAAARIMGAPEGTRHRTILAEARSLRRLIAAGAISEGHATSVIQGAAAAAGKNDPREIDGLMTWAASHPTGSAIHG